MNLGNTVRQWQMRWAQVRELEALGREQREALARDIGVPPEMLPALSARGPDCRGSDASAPHAALHTSMPDRDPE